MQLTEEKCFVLYRDILSAVNPNMSIKEIAKSVSKGNGKTYNVDWICTLLQEMERLKLIRRVIDEPKCVRYAKTRRGDRLVKMESLDELKKR